MTFGQEMDRAYSLMPAGHMEHRADTLLLLLTVIQGHDNTRLTASIQGNLGKLVLECQTVLNFVATRDDGSGSNNRNSHTCKAPVKSLPPTNTQFLQAR